MARDAQRRADVGPADLAAAQRIDNLLQKVAVGLDGVVRRPQERQQLFGRAFPLDTEVSIGRAAGCQITLDDTYSSQIHARVFQRDGVWQVEDLGSTNGTWINRQKVSGPMVMKPGDRLQIGNTILELQ